MFRFLDFAGEGREKRRRVLRSRATYYLDHQPLQSSRTRSLSTWIKSTAQLPKIWWRRQWQLTQAWTDYHKSLNCLNLALLKKSDHDNLSGECNEWCLMTIYVTCYRKNLPFKMLNVLPWLITAPYHSAKTGFNGKYVSVWNVNGGSGSFWNIPSGMLTCVGVAIVICILLPEQAGLPGIGWLDPSSPRMLCGICPIVSTWLWKSFM